MPAVPTRSAHASLFDCVAAFDDRLRDLAWQLANDILARELARAARGRSTPRRPPGRPRTARTAERQLPLRFHAPVAPPPLARDADAPGEPQPAGGAAEAPDQPPPPAPTGTAPPSGRAWTRDRVITELATWLLQESGLDAATLTRRGQAPLATWSRRLFGRFDAALSAANLHLAARYPDGLPTRAGCPP